MTDKNTVMSWLEGLTQDDWRKWYSDSEVQETAKAAFVLLKEQEAVPVDTKVIGAFHSDIEVYCCRKCRTVLDQTCNYCPNCGQAVKWDD